MVILKDGGSKRERQENWELHLLDSFFSDQMIDKTKVEKSEAKATELEKKVCVCERSNN